MGRLIRVFAVRQNIVHRLLHRKPPSRHPQDEDSIADTLQKWHCEVQTWLSAVTPQYTPTFSQIEAAQM